MGPKVHHRRPAARHRDAVTGDLFDHTAFAGLIAQGHARYTLAAFDLGDTGAERHADPQRGGLINQLALGTGACIDDHRHVQPGLLERDRRAVGIVIVGHNHGPVPHGDTEVHRIVPHGGRQQNPRQVIAGKGQGPFDRPGRRDDLASADTPEAVARALLLGCVIGQAFIGQRITVVIDTRPHAPQAQVDIGHRLQRLDGLVDPFLGIHTVDLRRIDDRTPAPGCGLLGKQDTRAAFPRSLGRRQTGDPAADDQNVDMRMEMLVGVLITILRRLAQTRGLANEGLVDMLPERTREHEHLVVEARRQEARQMRVDRADVEFEARPVVLRCRGQPVEHLCRGDTLVRLETPPLAEIDQSVGFLGPARDDPARAVVFERPPHQHLVIGQQCRGKRIAFISAQMFAVEGEGHRLAAVDQAALFRQTCAHEKFPHDQPGRF